MKNQRNSILSERTKQFIIDDLRQGNFKLDYISDIVREAIKTGLRQLGINIRRVSRQATSYEPPPIFDDPMKVIYYQRVGKQAAYYCPIDKCVITSGLSHADDSWHPFSATLEEYHHGSCQTYEGSILEKFYDTWQPRNAFDVLIGCEDEPAVLKDYSPQDYVLPWSAKQLPSPTKLTRNGTPDNEPANPANIEKYTNFIKHTRMYGGNPSYVIQKQIDENLWGYLNYGPATPLKGHFEYARLAHIYHSLSEEGFDRNKGDLGGFVPIKRGDDLRFIIRGGHHRIAAMKVLGYDTVPAVFDRPKIVDLAEVDYWPQVHSGIWDRPSAIRYIDHLFDFDGRAWARTHGLTRLQVARV